MRAPPHGGQQLEVPGRFSGQTNARAISTKTTRPSARRNRKKAYAYSTTFSSVAAKPRFMKTNARIDPPRIQRRYGQALQMKSTLFAVGCMPLLDGALWQHAPCFWECR